jgi:hypothetical protein
MSDDYQKQAQSDTVVVQQEEMDRVAGFEGDATSASQYVLYFVVHLVCPNKSLFKSHPPHHLAIILAFSKREQKWKSLAI